MSVVLCGEGIMANLQTLVKESYFHTWYDKATVNFGAYNCTPLYVDILQAILLQLQIWPSLNPIYMNNTCRFILDGCIFFLLNKGLALICFLRFKGYTVW